MRISDWSSDVCSSDLGEMEAEAAQAGDVLVDFARMLGDVLLAELEDQVARQLHVGGHEVHEIGEENTVGERIGGNVAEEADRLVRSEERLVGKEGVSTCRSRWSA